MFDVAIFHFSAKVISRAEGRSSVAAASYRSGEKITDQRTEEIHDYTRKSGVIDGDVILPGGGTMPRSELWNAVEAAHKRKDAMVAREFELALPCELTDAQRAELIARYCRELADEYGVAIDWNIHAPSSEKPNHHAHVMLSACYCSPDGSMGKKAVELDPIHCARAGILNPMEVQRSRWQDLCNGALERAGSAQRIDHRTLQAQGIDRAPGVHLGPAASAIERRGDVSEITQRARAAANEYISRAQAEAAIAQAQASVADLERELADIEAKAKATAATERAQAAYKSHRAADAAREAARIKVQDAGALHLKADEVHQGLLSTQRDSGILRKLWQLPKVLKSAKKVQKAQNAVKVAEARYTERDETATKARAVYVQLVPQPVKTAPDARQGLKEVQVVAQVHRERVEPVAASVTRLRDALRNDQQTYERPKG